MMKAARHAAPARQRVRWWLRLSLLAAVLTFAGQPPVFAQAGSEGGVIGKQNKSAAGADESPPPRATPPANSRRPAGKSASPDASSPCRGLPGNWNWSTGGVAIVSAGGTLKKGALTGSWTCKGGDVNIVWSHGYVDRLKLDPVEGKLSGKNNRGFGISGTRVN